MFPCCACRLGLDLDGTTPYRQSEDRSTQTVPCLLFAVQLDI
jgi:hypothetical protein